ncbi:MAG: HAD family phosphatase [Clostridia bacterium]|nr:HAD family phosphatase [Clostridia bacterium]MBQ7339209.1 HAD family phosphatase [Clostridia bacterium]
MAHIDAVIFDMDGTLFDTEQVYQRAWIEAGARLQFAHVKDALAACTGCNNADTRKYFMKTYADIVDYDEFAAVRDGLYDEIIEREGLQLKPGARETLQWLKGRGIPMALGTSTYPPRVPRNLEKAGLTQYFDAVVMGNMVKKGKPDPETFLTAAQMLGVKPEHCIGVEDSFNGVRALHAAGMYTIMVPDLVQPDAALLPLIDAVCDNLLEIQTIVEKINGWDK